MANEVLDAMPVHRFMNTEHGIMESYVRLNEHQQLIEIFKPCQNQRLQHYIKHKITSLGVPYLSEVNLFIDDWILNNYRMLKQGVVFD